MQEDKLKQLIKVFIVDNKFEKEKFREFVLGKLNKVLNEIEYLTVEDKYSHFWEKVNDYAVVMKNEELKELVVKLKELSKNLDKWIVDSVISKEKFDFCIVSKASEISSGNEDFDYFQAQLIRHDQLLSCLLIFEESLKHLRKLVKLEKKEMGKSRHLLFFLEKQIDKRIFELAVRFYEMRSAPIIY